MNEKTILVALALACSTTLAGLAADWPRFRGVNGSGVDAAAPVPALWDESTLLWSADVPGRGHGSPAVFGGRVYLLSAIPFEGTANAPASAGKGGKTDGQGKGKANGGGRSLYEWAALCYDAETGEALWERRFDVGRFGGHRFNSPASSTPAADGERIVFVWGPPESLTVTALSHGGELLWTRDLGPVAGGHGFGGSPVLHDGLVVLNNDQDRRQGSLLGLDAATGETRWEVERRSERISYSVPCVYETEGRELLVFVNWQHGFTAVDPVDGSVVADESVFPLDASLRAISSPVVAGDLVVGTCGYTGNPKFCVAMRLRGSDWEEVWRVERNAPHIPSVLAFDGLAFLVDDAGIATCLDASTGREKWRVRVPGVEGTVSGSPVSDGRKVFFPDESGKVHAFAAAAEFESLGTSRPGGLCRSTPALSAGTAYLRTERMLRAYR